MKGEFFTVLARSDTFWSETVLFVAFSVALIVCLVLTFKFLGKRIATLGVEQAHQKGAAAAVDFVLTLPIFMLVLFFNYTVCAHCECIYICSLCCLQCST